MPGPKILTLDIETSPSLAYIWKMWDENIGLSQLIEETEVLCWAAKWYGKKEVLFSSVYEDGKEVMIQGIWDLLNEADIVVHFNGRRFDMPHLRREFLLLGLSAPSPVRQIDLFQVVKSNFKFISNKLDHVAKTLGVGSKTKHTGFDLWRDCMIGTEDARADAWKLMEKYNKQDVRITERVYDELKAWMTSGHPHAALFKSEVDRDAVCCDICGSTDYQKRGPVHTNTATYQQYQCNECRHWFRGAKSIGKTVTRSIGMG